MDTLYVLKNEDTGKYYYDGEFVEPRKEYATALRLGKAKRIKEKRDIINNRLYDRSPIVIEKYIEED